MTITAQTSKTGPYSGNGTTTVFSYTFEVQDEAHLVVTLADSQGVETVQVLNTNYTVSGVGNANGGQITMSTAPASTYTLTISRSVPITQEVDLENRRSVAPEVLEDAYDKLTQIAQDLSEQLGRAIKISVTEGGNPTLTLEGDVQPGTFLGFDASGNLAQFAPASGTFISPSAAIVAVDDFTGDGTTVDFTLGGIPQSPNNLFIFLDGVMQDAANYTVSGTTLTFTTAPPLNTNIEVRRLQAVALTGGTTADLVTYSPAGSGAVNTTVETKLRELVSVKDFGAVGDGVTDDTAAIQAAIDAAISGRKALFFPRTDLGSLGLYRVTSALSISGSIHIYGEGTNYSGIRCEGCSGFQIDAGVNFVTIESMLIGQAVRYSTTANSYKAIETLGTTGSRNFWHIYRDLFIDGFEWPLQLSYTWSTVINSVTSVYGFGGVYATGVSVNNFVSNCSFGGSKTAGSAGIKIGDGTVATEGWMIQDSLIADFAIGVWGLGSGNCHVRGCIIDFFQQYGVFLQSSAASGALNWIVSENYMATDNAAASSGIRLKNDFAASSGQNRGHLINGNQILKYSGAALSYGISVDGTAEVGYVISGNRVDATTYACYLFTGTAPILSNNYWKGGSFATDVPVQYINNKGSMGGGAYPSPEGSFTPVVYGSSTAGTGTYTAQYGTYKVIDNLCFFTLRVNWTAHTGTGALRISGLPIASQAGVNVDPCVTVSAENLTFPAGTTSIIGLVRAGETNIELRGSGSGVGPTAVAMDATGNIAISGFYEIY